MKYEFHVGDYVETKNGAKGYVIDVEKLWWKCCFGDIDGYSEGYDYSIIGVADGTIAEFFNRIGQYDFTKKDEGKIKPLKKSWTLTDDVDGKGKYYFDSREVIKKINELMDTVNELRKKHESN